MKKAAYSSKLKCAFYGWRVVADGELALDIPEDCCCDMSGAIQIAEQIMPGCWSIDVFAGNSIDVIYKHIGGKWNAFDTCLMLTNEHR